MTTKAGRKRDKTRRDGDTAEQPRKLDSVRADGQELCNQGAVTTVMGRHGDDMQQPSEATDG